MKKGKRVIPNKDSFIVLKPNQSAVVINSDGVVVATHMGNRSNNSNGDDTAPRDNVAAMIFAFISRDKEAMDRMAEIIMDIMEADESGDLSKKEIARGNLSLVISKKDGDKYRIRSTVEKDDDGSSLYWSNMGGWVDKDSASVFNDSDRFTFNYLPVASEWEKV